MNRLHFFRQKIRQIAVIISTCMTGALLVGASGLAAAASQSASSSRMAVFTAAAQEFGVPVNVLLAISYNESRWQPATGPSVDGGYGLMGLRTYIPATVSGRDGSSVAPQPAPSGMTYSLDQAAGLLHVSADTIKTNDQQNVRGGAAVLAQDAKQLNNGQLPASVNDWYGAVAQMSGNPDAMVADSFADDVYATLGAGADLTTGDGQHLSLQAMANLAPNKVQNVQNQTFSALATPQTESKQLPGQNAECPATLNCRFIPAAYAQDDPNDPTNYGNYDPAHRPSDMKIKYIYIHDTEGSYDSAISHFQDPTSYVSAQYVVRSSDGAVTQMVPNEDVSWGVYDWYNNMHGINIENEGVAAQGATWYTPAMYATDAKLVRYLANKYNIPLDRQHILGHDNISVLRAANFTNQHWDPGPYWNWTYFMDLVHGQTPQQAAADTGAANTAGSSHLHQGDVVTIAPNFATNQPPITDCQTGTCVTLPAQGASFVYLRTQPNSTAPLLSDPYLHPDNSPGTTRDDDWGDKAPAGFQYVVAGTQGDWTEIWFAGTPAWFYNPHGANATAVKSWSKTLTPKAGLTSVNVYGAAYPEASAYPADVPVQNFDSLFTIKQGQAYATTGQNLPTDYFYDATINYSLPDDHVVVKGNTKYYQVSINHRVGYVKASDVVLSN